MKSDANPIDPTQRLRDAPRCSATAKSRLEAAGYKTVHDLGAMGNW